MTLDMLRGNSIVGCAQSPIANALLTLYVGFVCIQLVKIKEKEKRERLIPLSADLWLYFDDSPRLLYGVDHVCRGDEVLPIVVKLHYRTCRESLLTPRVALPLGNFSLSLLLFYLWRGCPLYSFTNF